MTAVAERTTLLNQVIAVRASVKNDTEANLTKVYHLLQRSELLAGLTRTYTPRDDEGFRYPPETTNVQVTTEQILKNISVDLSRLFDVTGALDWTNQDARADVVLLNGPEPVILLNDVPVSYLMFLEKQLTNMETLIRKLPILPVTENWTFDPASDTYRSEPVGTVKTAKVRRNHVLAEATDRHPAQVESYTEDVPVGTWSTVKFSGAIPAKRANTMLARVTTLMQAVKFARERANLAVVVEPKPGRAVMDYIFAPDPADA